MTGVHGATDDWRSPPWRREDAIAASANDVKPEDWREPRAITRDDPGHARVDVLWTLFGITLLGAFLSFVLATS